MKKRILFVNSSLTDGGSERVMTLLANQFAKEDFGITMVLLRDKEKITYPLDLKINCVRFKYNSTNKIYIASKRIYMLRKLLKQERFDVVISFMHDINITTLLAGWKLNVPIIVSERANPKARNVSFIYRWIEHNAYLSAKKIVFQTEQAKEMYHRKIQDKSAIIPNPVNNDLPTRYEGDREKIIVAAGRMTDQKNFYMLLRAFNRFHDKFPEYKLTIFGVGPLLQDLKSKTQNLAMEQYVNFPGYVEDVNGKMRKAAMYVSSSDFEGISNSMVEALAMGIPTICTDCPVGGAAMMINDGTNGLLIPVGDEDALTDAMLQIAENAHFSKALSVEAIKIRNTFSIEKVAELWKRLF